MANNSILIQGLIELHLAGKGGDEAVSSMKQIIAQANQVEKEIGQVGAQAKKTDESIVGMAKSLYTYFAASQITSFLRDSYLGFAKTERQALATENQIKSLGQAAQGAGFRDFISQLSDTSGILDDDLVPAFQRALLAFKDYAVAQEVVSKAARFAAAGIGDVQSNTEAMARFFNTGAARSLVQFGVNVKGGETAVLGLTEGFRLLDEQLGKQPQAFSDAQRRIEAIKNAYDTATDTLAKFLDLAVRSTLFGGQDLPQTQQPETGPVYGPQQETALERSAREEQARRDKDANDKKVREELEAEQKIAEQRYEIERKTEDDILKLKIDSAEKWSTERYSLELEALKRQRDAEIKAAEEIGADVEKINEKFGVGVINMFKSYASARVQAARDVQDELDKIRDEDLEKEREANREKLKAELDRNDAEFAAYYDYVQDRIDLNKLEADTRQAQMDTLLGATQTFLATAFEDSKAAAIASAIINTAEGVTKALAQGGYFGIAMAAIVAATGAVQIAKIQSTTRGSNSSGGSVSVGGTTSQSRVSSVPSQLDTARGNHEARSGVVVNINGGVYTEKRALRKLSRDIAKAARGDAGMVR